MFGLLIISFMVMETMLIPKIQISRALCL
uniref:Uncharacterized protein n=1 Tax=Rhizophora mucronata TaxID=61149 RepID=A0A2P2Q0J4_RHIMU